MVNRSLRKPSLLPNANANTKCASALVVPRLRTGWGGEVPRTLLGDMAVI